MKLAPGALKIISGKTRYGAVEPTPSLTLSERGETTATCRDSRPVTPSLARYGDVQSCELVARRGDTRRAEAAGHGVSSRRDHRGLAVRPRAARAVAP